MRTAFIGQLIEEAENNEKIFLVVGDLGFSVVEPFAEQFPDRFLNVGIAEQNMAGVAAGLAMEGYIVYIYSIGNFPTLRCMEQIRYDICYHNLNVKVVAVGGGYSYGALGPSHHATEEFGMLRIIPNMTVCAPGDPEEARRVTTFSANNYGPCYIRLGKAGEPLIHQRKLSPFTAGEIIKVMDGFSTAVFSTGATLKYVVDFISQHQLNAAVYSFPFIKPINQHAFLDIVSKYKKIITIEEHQSHGGFGSAILELTNDLIEMEKIKTAPAIHRIAINNRFYSVAGSQCYLREIAGLTLRKEYFIDL